MSMDYIRRTYGVPAKRGGRISFTSAARAVKGTIVGSRGHYLRVRIDESGMTHSMHSTWMVVYLEREDERWNTMRKAADFTKKNGTMKYRQARPTAQRLLS